MKWLCLFLLLFLAAGSVTVAKAAQVGFAITERLNADGTESASAILTSDPSAIIIVSRLFGTAGETWLIDLSQSGHVVPGAPWPNGFTVATWAEPEHPGLWNNLTIDNPQHMHLDSEWTFATGQNMGLFPNGFGNGVSYYAGNDVNGDQVFVSVTEASPTKVKTTTWGKLKAVYSH